MAREFIKRTDEIFEDITKKSLGIVGIEADKNKVKLLIRLILSGIAQHYFYNPDDIIDVGFLQFSKNPDKDELFKVNIIKSVEDGVFNADTLWKFYSGELHQQQKCKEILENFLTDLIEYSQEQEVAITKLTTKLKKKRRN